MGSSENGICNCWSKGKRVHSFHVELADGGFFIFPYACLLVARFEQHNDGDAFYLHLTTHEIHIEGRNLRELALAFQKFAVESIREIGFRSQALPKGMDVRIESVAISETRRSRLAKGVCSQTRIIVPSTQVGIPQIPESVGSTTVTTPTPQEHSSQRMRMAYSVAEAAQLLGVHYFSVYRLIQRGKLRVCRVLRGKILVPRSELLRLLNVE
jgi:excisionase family DNA binding protein